MKLFVEIDGEQSALDVQRDGDRVVATVDDRRYELSVSDFAQHSLLMIADHEAYECFIERVNQQPSAAAVVVHVRNQTYHARLSDLKRLRSYQQTSDQRSNDRAQIKALMAGKVVSVLTELGASVAAGDGLMIVEAMKMQNEVKAARAGKVTELRVEAGATVNAGDLLATIE